MSKSTEKFWMIWTPASRPPVVAHKTLESALQEAERLALCNPGKEYYVLMSSHKVVTTKVDVVEIE